MKFASRTFQTKTGLAIEIHGVASTAAQALIDLKRSYIAGANSIPIELSEYNHTIEEETDLIQKYNQSENSMLLVAAHQNKFIGNIDLTGSERNKMKHTGMIGMGIQKEWRGQGVGSFLMEAVLDWAKEHPLLKIIWLDVYANNEKGLALYKKMDFQISGVVQDFFLEGEEYIDKIQMWRRV